MSIRSFFLLWRIKESYFWFSSLSGITIATGLSGGALDFLKVSFSQISEGFGSYKHLKFRPVRQLKYRL